MKRKIKIYCKPIKVLLQAYTNRSVMFIIMMLGIFNPIQAQTVKGTVADDKGEPLFGVNVLLKNTKTGVSTDLNGQFEISVNNQNNPTLLFNYLGYKEKEILVAGKTVLNVTLIQSESTLDEVVVTALGIKKESKKLGYSVETVNNDDLQKNRNANMMASLEGKVAGLDISPPSAGAGASAKIRLRGQSAFAGASNSPLIVVNGLPMDQNARGANGNDSRDLGDNLQGINPDDIESMTVLKGATAAALYGYRAANGAIIITTKNGKKNQGLGIELTSNFTSQSVLDYSDFQKVYGQGVGGKKPTSAADAASNGQYGFGARLDGLPTYNYDGVLRPYSYDDNRITGFYRTGLLFSNTIAISGGGEKGSFRASFSHSQASGIQPDNEYTKKIANLGLNHNLSKKLSVSVNLNYTHEDNINPPEVGVQGAGAPNFLYRMAGSIPLEAFKTSVIDPATTTEWRSSGFQSTVINPYFNLGRQFFNDIRDRFLMTASLKYELTDWLYAQGRVNYDYSDNTREFNTPTGRGSSTPMNGAGTGYNGNYEVRNIRGTDLNADFLIGANKTFGDFSVDLSVGGNIYKTKSSDSRQFVTDFTVRDLYSIENGITKNQSYGIGRSQVNSLYTFADLGYKGLFYLNVTARNDWYSVLNPKNNSYLYPSVGGSFIFSELMKDNDWLSYGKIRASYAEVGSSNGIGAFNGNLNYSINQNQFNGQVLGSIAGDGSSPNRNLKPFTVAEKEVGLELKMFKSRVNLDVAAFEKTTTDQILNVQISSTSGYTTTPQNLASLQNRGVEFMLEVIPIKTNNFKWSSNFNSTFVETEVLELAPGVNNLVVQSYGGNEFLGQLVYQVGQPLNQLSAKTYKRDANGKLLLDSSGRIQASTEYVNFGSALPKWTGGWTNTFSYKNMSLLVFFDYKLGGKVISSTALNGARQGLNKMSLYGREGNVVLDGIIESTGQPNTNTLDTRSYWTDHRNGQIGDPFIFKSDFVKLRTITFTYDLTSLIKQNNNFIQALTLAASCHNVLLISSDLPDLDPEAFASSGDFRVGYEQATLPTTRNFSLNLNVKF
jgi:TonB-linked SusC/RagA family outer membrane protein